MTDFDTIIEVVFGLQTISSTNEKKEFLSKFKGNAGLERYLKYVYDEVNYVYGKSKVPVIARQNFDAKLNNSSALEELYSLLDSFIMGELKGNAADQAMQDLFVSTDERIETLCEYVLKRDIKAKVGAKLINEVLGRIIPVAPYQRCESEDMMQKRIIYPAITQTKADGAFMNCSLLPQDDITVACSTRYGRYAPDNNFFQSLEIIGEKSKYIDPVLHGELLLKHEDGTIMNRQTGNGKINKYFKKESTRKELVAKFDKANGASKVKAAQALEDFDTECEYIENNLIYVVWDIVPSIDWFGLRSELNVQDRFQEVSAMVKIYNDLITPLGNCELRLVNYKIVADEEEAMEFYREQLDAGEEGMVIKNLNATWEHDTNRQGIIKLKDFNECDLIITGWNYGKTGSEFELGIGSYICESSDGELKVDVSGMSRDQRGFERVDLNDSSKGIKLIDGFDFDQNVGKIITVKYNELIKSKNSDTYSLFLPSVEEIREGYDKSLADDLVKIKANKKSK